MNGQVIQFPAKNQRPKADETPIQAVAHLVSMQSLEEYAHVSIVATAHGGDRVLIHVK